MTKQATAHVMDMINELRVISSTNDKQDIILRYTGGVEEQTDINCCQDCTQYGVLSRSMYNVTSKQVKNILISALAILNPDMVCLHCSVIYALVDILTRCYQNY